MYKKYLLIILAIPLLLSAQNKSKINSLTKIIASSIQDTIRYKTLIALAGEHLDASPALAMIDMYILKTL